MVTGVRSYLSQATSVQVISRQTVQCRTCGERVVLRIGIGPVAERRLICQCPTCKVALRLSVSTPPQGNEIEFLSDDLDRIDYDPDRDGDLRTLVLYADLPVPIHLMGQRASYARESPFIYWASRLWSDKGALYSAKSNVLNEMRETIYPAARRAASLVEAGDFERLGPALEANPIAKLLEGTPGHPVYRFARLLDLMFSTFCEIVPRAPAIGEFLFYLGNSYRERRLELAKLIKTFQDELGLSEFRRRTIATAIGFLERSDALLPGLAWDHIDGPVPSADGFRIARADFDQLRGRYVEAFELGSQMLTMIGAVANLDRRGDATRWANGETTGLRKMMEKRAYDREFILGEFEFAPTLYEAVNRQSRNDFGHYSVEFDFSTGELVNKSGRRTSFVLFLVDYLAAARLTWYLVGVCEKLTLEALDADSEHRLIAMKQGKKT